MSSPPKNWTPSKVKTTPKQARQILERNSIALEMLQNGPWFDEGEFTVKVGCPHCGGSCRHCAYPSNESGILFGEQCLHYKFGGVSYYNVNCIINISRDFYLLRKANSNSIGPQTRQTEKKDPKMNKCWDCAWHHSFVKRPDEPSSHGCRKPDIEGYVNPDAPTCLPSDWTPARSTTEEHARRLLRLHEACSIHEYRVWLTMMENGVLTKSFHERMLRHRTRKKNVENLLVKLIRTKQT